MLALSVCFCFVLRCYSFAFDGHRHGRYSALSRKYLKRAIVNRKLREERYSTVSIVSISCG